MDKELKISRTGEDTLEVGWMESRMAEES